MVTTGRITSQGQLSIPIAIRRLLGIQTPSNVFMSIDDEKIVIEPVKSFEELAGVFHDSAIKNKTADEIIRMEEKVAEKLWREKSI